MAVVAGVEHLDEEIRFDRRGNSTVIAFKKLVGSVFAGSQVGQALETQISLLNDAKGFHDLAGPVNGDGSVDQFQPGDLWPARTPVVLFNPIQIT